MAIFTSIFIHVNVVWFLFHSVCVYGGGSRREQVKIVSKGVEIVIGESSCTD